MQFKTTQKAVREVCNRIICVPYCGLQNLLAYEIPVAYTVRREGWAADIYDMDNGVAIVTGYAPFGNIRPPYELLQQYETQAEKIRNNYSLDWETRRAEMWVLLQAFVEDVIHN